MLAGMDYPWLHVNKYSLNLELIGFEFPGEIILVSII